MPAAKMKIIPWDEWFRTPRNGRIEFDLSENVAPARGDAAEDRRTRSGKSIVLILVVGHLQPLPGQDDFVKAFRAVSSLSAFFHQ
jgi:hypothetical protein